MAKSANERENAPQSAKRPRGLQAALAAARLAAENEGRDILLLDMRRQTALFDYFLIVTGKSGRQLRAIADEVDDLLRKQFGDRRLSVDGYSDSRWIVLDFGDLVVHLFDGEMRKFYRLEDLWADAERVPLDTP